MDEIVNALQGAMEDDKGDDKGKSGFDLGNTDLVSCPPEGCERRRTGWAWGHNVRGGRTWGTEGGLVS